MARIAGVTLPNSKRIEYALTYVYGIGLKTSQQLLQSTQIDPNTRVHELSDADVQKLREAIDGSQIKVEGDLRREVASNIKRYKEIHSYRGMRHSRGLPVRGQRTKTNTRTRRGNVRKTAGSGRKAAAQKT